MSIRIFDIVLGSLINLEDYLTAMDVRGLLLAIGIAGLLAGVYGLWSTDDWYDDIITMVCGAALIYGYYRQDDDEHETDS
jgi:hypothetical protein